MIRLLWGLGMGTSLPIFLREEVDKRGWNDSDLADRAGVTRSSLSKIMKGKTKVPSLETLDRLSHALEVPLIHLVALCGFAVDSRVDVPFDEQIAILLETAPGFRSAVDKVAQLLPDDLRALQSYLDGSLRRVRPAGRR